MGSSYKNGLQLVCFYCHLHCIVVAHVLVFSFFVVVAVVLIQSKFKILITLMDGLNHVSASLPALLSYQFDKVVF